MEPTTKLPPDSDIPQDISDYVAHVRVVSFSLVIVSAVVGFSVLGQTTNPHDLAARQLEFIRKIHDRWHEWPEAVATEQTTWISDHNRADWKEFDSLHRSARAEIDRVTAKVDARRDIVELHLDPRFTSGVAEASFRYDWSTKGRAFESLGEFSDFWRSSGTERLEVSEFATSGVST